MMRSEPSKEAILTAATAINSTKEVRGRMLSRAAIKTILEAAYAVDGKWEDTMSTQNNENNPSHEAIEVAHQYIHERGYYPTWETVGMSLTKAYAVDLNSFREARRICAMRDEAVADNEKLRDKIAELKSEKEYDFRYTQAVTSGTTETTMGMAKELSGVKASLAETRKERDDWQRMHANTDKIRAEHWNTVQKQAAELALRVQERDSFKSELEKCHRYASSYLEKINKLAERVNNLTKRLALVTKQLEVSRNMSNMWREKAPEKDPNKAAWSTYTHSEPVFTPAQVTPTVQDYIKRLERARWYVDNHTSEVIDCIKGTRYCTWTVSSYARGKCEAYGSSDESCLKKICDQLLG